VESESNDTLYDNDDVFELVSFDYKGSVKQVIMVILGKEQIELDGSLHFKAFEWAIVVVRYILALLKFLWKFDNASTVKEVVDAANMLSLVYGDHRSLSREVSGGTSQRRVHWVEYRRRSTAIIISSFFPQREFTEQDKIFKKYIQSLPLPRQDGRRNDLIQKQQASAFISDCRIGEMEEKPCGTLML